MSKGIGGHHSHVMGKDEWLTPPDLISKIGRFDLDPCSPIDRPWPTADRHLTVEDDGLLHAWDGRVWCNPPYGKHTADWLEKLSVHGNGIALVFARTETRMFFSHVWPKASAVLFIEGRLHFHHVDGSRAKANSGAPSVLIAYGQECCELLRNCDIAGKFVQLK